MIVSSYHYLLGPAVAIAALLVILALCRWAFPSEPRRRPARRSVAPRDYGLLVPIATVRTREDVEMLRGVLAENGIRGTVSEPVRLPGRTTAVHVLVFREDALRARELVDIAR